MLNNNSVGPNFWESFVSEYWEQTAYCCDKFFKEAPIKDEILFSTILNDNRKSFFDYSRLYIDDMLQEYSLSSEFYPVKTDKSFKGYHERLTKRMGVKEYCLIIQDPHIFDFTLWEWFREFLCGMYDIIGFNKLGNNSALFIGNYSRTPLGVHADPESVFHIPVVGKKAMRIWSNDYKINNTLLASALEYKSFIPGSILIEASPGGILYWPSESWHISEKVDEFSVSIAIGLNCNKGILTAFLHHIDKSADDFIRFNTDSVIPVNFKDIKDSATLLPEDLNTVSQFIQEMSSHNLIHRLWIKLITGFNFISPPSTLELSTENRSDLKKTMIVTSLKYLIIHVKMDDKLVISYNGHLLDHKYCEDIISLISMFNHGIPIILSSITKDFPNIGENEVLNIVLWLQKVRAIKQI